jgi:hypothetical protein
MAVSDAKEWRALYQAAVFCRGETQDRAKRLAEAEEAIVERMRQLFLETGMDAAEERAAMDDAMYALNAWKTVLRSRTHAA